MSFVTLGGEASARPTFFELLAADKLLPSLKSAIAYSLSVSGLFEAWEGLAACVHGVGVCRGGSPVWVTPPLPQPPCARHT